MNYLMKFFTRRNIVKFLLILGLLVILNINFTIAARIKTNKLKSLKNETNNNQTNNETDKNQLNNETDKNQSNNNEISHIIKDFPLKIEINWISIKENLNLHLKRVEKGRQIKDQIVPESHRIFNETSIKSQTMMLEKLVSGVYILYAEKFVSLKNLDITNPSVSIFSDTKSYYNITCNKTATEHLNWEKPVFWEIGKFEFFGNSAVFENFNFLTNEIIEKRLNNIAK